MDCIGLTRGNIIKANGLIGVFQAFSLAADTVLVSIDNRLVEKSPEEIEGIPITSEWLDIFGMYSSYKGGSHEKMIGGQRFSVSLYSDHEYVSVTCTDEIKRDANLSLRGFKIYYLHQLQNLYILRFGEDAKYDTDRIRNLVQYTNHVARIDLQIKEMEQNRLESQKWAYPELPEEINEHQKIDFDNILRLNFGMELGKKVNLP